MSFKPGDAVIHKSDKTTRKMVVVTQVFKESPPSNRHSELANIGHVVDGSYYCTWISGAKKGEGYFAEIELQLQAEKFDKNTVDRVPYEPGNDGKAG